MKQEQFDRFLSELRSKAEPPPEAKWFLFFSRFFHFFAIIGGIGIYTMGYPRRILHAQPLRHCFLYCRRTAVLLSL